MAAQSHNRGERSLYERVFTNRKAVLPDAIFISSRYQNISIPIRSRRQGYCWIRERTLSEARFRTRKGRFGTRFCLHSQRFSTSGAKILVHVLRHPDPEKRHLLGPNSGAEPRRFRQVERKDKLSPGKQPQFKDNSNFTLRVRYRIGINSSLDQGKQRWIQMDSNLSLEKLHRTQIHSHLRLKKKCLPKSNSGLGLQKPHQSELNRRPRSREATENKA